MVKIAPSILSADFSRLGEELCAIEKAGADWVHIDVMDGSFVPNITVGAPVVKALRKCTKLPFDVHLMIEHPENHVAAFAEAGADIITFHMEATRHAHRLIEDIKKRGVKAGVALNPATPLVMLEEILGDIDMALIMTVNPGFGGQKFIASMAEKVALLRHTVNEEEFETDIEVDGGVNLETAALLREAGANILVAGSAVYGAKDMARVIKSMRGEA